jgi:hypothetical protein
MSIDEMSGKLAGAKSMISRLSAFPFAVVGRAWKLDISRRKRVSNAAVRATTAVPISRKEGRT